MSVPTRRSDYETRAEYLRAERRRRATDRRAALSRDTRRVGGNFASWVLMSALMLALGPVGWVSLFGYYVWGGDFHGESNDIKPIHAWCIAATLGVIAWGVLLLIYFTDGPAKR